MCAVFTSLGSASAFMLLTTLLLYGASGDKVTTQQCKNRVNRTPRERVRHYPEDPDATKLWLDYCNLDKINEDDIIGLQNITTIYLDHNALGHVDLAVFRHVPTLELLRLDDNKLRELPAFPEHSCARLAELQLSNNQLTTLSDAGTFSACTHLQELYLYNNQIHYIHPDVFSSLAKLERLELDNNKLSFIPDQMLANNKKLRVLWLNKNRLTDLPQDFASSFKRKGGRLVTFYFYDNPWHCACLLELLADVKRAGGTYYDFWHTYDGTQPECVYSGAVPCRPPSPPELLPPPRVATGGGR